MSNDQMVVALCRMVRKGLLTGDAFWAAFDSCRVYMVRPEYNGMAMFTAPDGSMMSPVFSTVQRLSQFVRTESDWVELPVSDLWGLGLLPRIIVVDPGSPDEIAVDVSTRPQAGSSAVSAVAGSLRITGIESDGRGGIVGQVSSQQE